MVYQIWGRLFVLLLLSLYHWEASANSTTTTELTTPSYTLAVLPDPSASLPIEQVVQQRIAADFKPLPYGTFSGGFTRSAHWFRLTVQAPAGEWWLDLQPPVLDDVRLFVPDPQHPGDWLERRSGDSLPFAMREVPYRGFVFKLQHTDNSSLTYYLRLETSSTSVLTPRIMSPAEFISSTHIEVGLLMSSVVVVLVVVLLNVNAYFWLRDSLTAWFIGHLLSFAGYFFCTNGFTSQYIFPDAPQTSYYFMTGFSLLLIGSSAGFYRRLFNIQRKNRILFWLYESNCWLPIISLPLAMLGWQTEILPFFLYGTIATTTVGCVLSLNLWFKKHMGSGPLLIANLLSFSGIVFAILHFLGAVSGGGLAWHSLQITSLGCVLALHITLGARYRGLSEARQHAEQKAQWEYEQRIQQQDFLSMLTHELRTSLSVLRMAIGIQPMTAKSIAKAERAMISMEEVIEQSIRADKLDSGNLSINPAPCDIGTLVEAVVADSRDPNAVQTQLPRSVVLDTDARLLRVIINNLIDNALKYRKDNTPITVHLSQQNAKCCLRVSNEIGSAGSPDAAQVFDKYYRAPEAHQTTGSGLGLHIAAALTKLLGGTLAYLPKSSWIHFELHLTAPAKQDL